MKKYLSEEIQQVSSNFRGTARRLTHTDYDQSATNLKRLMNVINLNELIKNFIDKNNVVEYDIQSVIKNRGWLDPFNISADMKEEISFEYQMLQYAIENFDGDFSQLYGGFFYTSAQSSRQDEMRTFIEHIIDPLIDYISDYLRDCLNQATKEEERNASMSKSTINATNSNVVIGSLVGGDISNKVSVDEKLTETAASIISAIEAQVKVSQLENKEDIEEILADISKEIKEGKKPKNSWFTVLKTLCNGTGNIVDLVKKLSDLFPKEESKD